MPNLISGPYRFIESGGDGPVHLEFFSSPGWTLCGFEFAQDGSAKCRIDRDDYRQSAEGSGANGRIWPAMMSAELPEGGYGQADGRRATVRGSPL